MKKNQLVNVEKLRVGMFIHLPLAWKDHPFLFNSFKLKDQAQIELLKQLNLKQVEIDVDKSEVSKQQEQQESKIDKSDITSLKEEMDEQKNAQIEERKKLLRNLKRTEKQFDRSLSMMRSLVTKIGSRPLNAVNEAKELINNLTDMLLETNDLALHLMRDAKPDDVIYHHSLNVSMLCMLMAKELGWERKKIELIGMGALFHDVGKLKIPTNILQKREAHTDVELNLLKQHPLMSLNFLKLADTFPEEAKPLIANHHEFLDGSGFPKGLKGDQIDEMAQLISVVNEYDNLCNGNVRKKGKPPSVALGLLYKNFQKKLNKEFLSKFIKKLGVYPPGSVVELSNGQFALVMSVNLQKILLPNVIVYDPKVPKDQAPIIDLEKESISIVRSLPPAALPEKVFNYLSPREVVSFSFGKN